MGPLAARLGTFLSCFDAIQVPELPLRALLLAEHNPAPFWGHKTHLNFGLCREGRGVHAERQLSP